MASIFLKSSSGVRRMRVDGAYEHEMDNFSAIGCGQTDPGHGLNRLIVDLGLRWSEVPDRQFIVGQFIVKIPAALSNSFIKQLQFGGYLGCENQRVRRAPHRVASSLSGRPAACCGELSWPPPFCSTRARGSAGTPSSTPGPGRAIRSSVPSSPTEIRTTPSPSPIAARPSGPIARCVVVAGCVISDLASPRLLEMSIDPQLVQDLEGALLACPRAVELERDHGAAARHLPLGQVVLRMRRQERVLHPAHRGCPSRNSAIRSADAG